MPDRKAGIFKLFVPTTGPDNAQDSPALLSAASLQRDIMINLNRKTHTKCPVNFLPITRGEDEGYGQFIHSIHREGSLMVLRFKWYMPPCILFCFCLLSSCAQHSPGQAQLSLEDAHQIALEFQGKYASPPPQGLGAYVHHFIEKYRTVDQKVMQRCSVPGKKISDDDIDDIAASFSYDYGISTLRLMGGEEFLNGNVRTAVKFMDKARELAESRGWYHEIANSQAEKAVIMADIGDYIRAGGLVRQAEDKAFDWYSGGKSAHGWNRLRTQYMVARGRAVIAYAKGDLETAELEFYKALKYVQNSELTFMLDVKGSIWRIADAKLRMAKNLLWQGKLTEAEIWSREAVLDADEKFRPFTLVGLAEVLFAQGRLEDAAELAKTARNYLIDRCFAADSLIRGQARELLGKILVGRERWQEALDEFETIEQEMGSDPATFESRFRGSIEWGVALMMCGRYASAFEHLQYGALRIKDQFGNDHYNSLESHALMAMAQSHLEGRGAAIEQLGKILPQLIRRVKASGGEPAANLVRTQRLRLLLEAYLQFLERNSDDQRIDEAFRLAGALQSQSVGKALEASAVRSAAGDPGLIKLIRQRQDLEIQLIAQQNRIKTIMVQSVDRRNQEVLTSLNSETGSLRAALAMLDSEVKYAFPRYAALVDPPMVGIAEVRRVLDNDEALISFFVGKERLYIWSFASQGPIIFTSVALGYGELVQIINRLRAQLDPEKVFTLGDLSVFDTRLSHSLYKKILEPVANGYHAAGKLLVVPDGPIGQLPLSVLVTEAVDTPDRERTLFVQYRDIPWLAQDYAVTYLPSLAVLAQEAKVQTTNHPNKEHSHGIAKLAFAGFGDPVFNRQQIGGGSQKTKQLASNSADQGGMFPYRGIRVHEKLEREKENVTLEKLNRLPDTRQEILSIAKSLGANPEKDTHLGVGASEEAVKHTDLSNRKVIVFASHALLPGDLDGLLQPAIALSSPSVTGGKEDGLLTMGEVMGLKLNSDWVVLSACNTAAGNGAGAEAVSGLGQAFFYAGTRALLVTSWAVETTSARAYTESLFRRLAMHPEMDRAKALQKTRREIMNKSGAGFSYAHPIFWAPYIMVGSH